MRHARCVAERRVVRGVGRIPGVRQHPPRAKHDVARIRGTTQTSGWKETHAMTARSDSDLLIVLLDGRVIGELQRDRRRGDLVFTYDASWRTRPDAVPLSVTMPVAGRSYPDAIVSPFFRALLPDNALGLDALTQRHQLASGDTFGLLRALGGDCPGALQCVQPTRLADVQSGRLDAVTWLTKTEVIARLRALRQPGASGRVLGDSGQFSLAGQQAKTALLYDDVARRWGIPAGRVPTTHILKPAPLTDPQRADNEHSCLVLARAAGLLAAASWVWRTGDEHTLVVERYDRRRLPDGTIARIHQEDLCQAIGIAPERKYEASGGPTAVQIMQFLRERAINGSRAVDQFLRALAYNWIILGSDAHARNFSVVLTAGGEMAIAPLYDLTSALPYAKTIPEHTVNLSMRIGDTRHATSIGSTHWRQLTDEAGLEWTHCRTLMLDLLNAVGTALPQLESATAATHGDAAFVGAFSTRVARRVRRCASQLGVRG